MGDKCLLGVLFWRLLLVGCVVAEPVCLPKMFISVLHIHVQLWKQYCYACAWLAGNVDHSVNPQLHMNL